MIQLASCLLPFMLHATAPRQTDAYLRAIPQSPTLVAVIPDVADFLEAAEDCAWFRFLDRECLEDGWPSPFTDDDGEEVEALVATLESIRSGALYMLGDGEDPETVFGFVAQLDGPADEFGLQLEETLFEEAESSEVVEIDGVPVRIVSEDNEGEFEFTAMYTHDNVIVVSLGVEREVLMAHVEDTLEALGDPAARGIESNRNYTAARDAGSGGHIEFYIDLSILIASADMGSIDVPMVEEVMGDLRSCYATAWLGSGQELEVQFDLHHGTENVLSDILELLEPASEDLLRFVPRDSLMISSMGLDIEGTIDLVMDLMDETGSLSSEEAEEALDAFAEQTGVHILDDLLRLMTGDAIAFGRDETFSQEDMAGTVLIGLTQGEDFLDGIEDMLSALGMSDAIETDEYGGADVYILDDGTGFVAYGTITDEFLAICVDEDDLHHVIDASNSGGGPSILDSKRFAAALEQMSGTSNFRLQQITTTVEMVGTALRDAAETESIEGIDALLEVLTDHFDDAEVIARYFSGLFAYSMDTDDGVTTLRFETL